VCAELVGDVLADLSYILLLRMRLLPLPLLTAAVQLRLAVARHPTAAPAAVVVVLAVIPGIHNMYKFKSG
jgi:hypothetical protein